MGVQTTKRAAEQPALGRRALFRGLALALSGLLLAGCPGRNAPMDAPRRSSGGSGYRRY